MGDLVEAHVLVEACKMRDQDELRPLDAAIQLFVQSHRFVRKQNLRESSKVFEQDGFFDWVPRSGEQTSIRLGETEFWDLLENPGSVKELGIWERTRDADQIVDIELESKSSLRKASSDKVPGQRVCR